jgi:hypothetical protein
MLSTKVYWFELMFVGGGGIQICGHATDCYDTAQNNNTI